MQNLFATRQQRRLARCVFAMDVYRRHVLGKGVLYGVRPKLQPVGYVAALAYPACLRHAGTPYPAALVGRVRLSQEALGITVGAIAVAVLWVLACCITFWCVNWLGR
jgi:hypothetical protein